VSAVSVRPLEAGDELASAWQLTMLAFGFQPSDPAQRPDASKLPEGRLCYGAFDSNGRLTGTIHDVCHEQWWGGRPVAAADVSAVAVLPEARGSGTARAMLKAVLQGAYERGAAVSALYPTASAVYSASGWGVGGRLRTVDFPAALLATIPGLIVNDTRELTVRAADPGGADQPAIRDLYERVARPREGLLTRCGAAFPEQGWPKGIDGITLVLDGETLVGYASWMRGTGYRADAVLEVPDLLAVTPAAARELLSMLAGWRSVTPTVRLRPLEFDPITPLLPWESGTNLDARPWMHRPVDVAKALGSRGWPLSRRGRVTFHLHDPVASWNDGAWQFDVADGEGELVRTGTHPELRLHVAGFAMLYSGHATPTMLAEAGLLHGPGSSINGLELIRPKSAAQLLDYF
jgi:predicted acetyltransferase